MVVAKVKYVEEEVVKKKIEVPSIYKGHTHTPNVQTMYRICRERKKYEQNANDICQCQRLRLSKMRRRVKLRHVCTMYNAWHSERMCR